MPATFQEHNQKVIDYYEGRKTGNMIPTGSPYVNHHLDEFTRFCGLTKDQRILDVGCGMGRYTLFLAERGYKVEGLDISPYLLEQLQKFNTGHYTIPTYCMDVVNAPAEMNGQFDAVVGFFVLHHMHDLTACYTAMTRLVKPGGIVAFLEPNAFNIAYYIQIMVTPTMTWKGDGGMAKMRPGVIFPAMQAGGLTNLRVHRFGFFPPFITNTKIGLWFEKRLEKFPLWRGLLPGTIFIGQKPS